jgi:group I intron endonuclease
MYGIVMAVTNLKLCTEEIEPLVKRIGTCIPMKACQPASLMAFYLINDMGCVYCATNQINGKQYIGKTIHKLSCRKKQHIKSAKNNSKLAFHEALRKYGLNNFVWKKIFEDNDNGLLLSAETHYIKKYNTISPHGYNLTYGGEGTSFSKETIKKIRELTKKQWNNNKT